MGCPVAKNLEISFLLDFYGDVLTERQREVMEQYYNDDLSLAEIADNFGITRQGVRDSIKRAESQLLEMEERLGLVKRFRTVRAQLSEIAQAAQEIRELNRSAAFSHEIDERAGQIAALSQALAAE